MNLQQIKDEQEKAVSQLMKDCRVFFAFSKKQFEENKTELQEGDKYLDFGSGGFCPKSLYKTFSEGFDKIDQNSMDQIKANNLQETEIKYELANHECYYTGDISPVVDMFDGTYSREQIRKVYNENIKQNQEY